MTRVSGRLVKSDVSKKIFNLLTGYIASIGTRKNSNKFLRELLTDAEQIMLAKRLAVVVMLVRKESYTTIQAVLKVSPDTVSRIAQEKEMGHFSFIENQCGNISSNKIGDKEFWDLLEKILLAGMPPRGKGRWKYLHEITKDD